jgi:hypothetical protein
MKKLFASALALVSSAWAIAQEKSTDINVDINKGGGDNWYASPWVWVLGAVIFIILLLALTSGSRRSSGDRVIVKKTVRRDVSTDPDVV